jgi:hypothetical protein
MTHFDRALRMVLMMLRAIPAPTSEQIGAKVALVLPMLKQEDPSFDVEAERLIRHIESLCNITIGRDTLLQDRTNHQPWLPAAKSGIDWKFWARYRQYILEDKGWTNTVVDRLDELTDKILGLLENPNRDGIWDTRGMIVGQVQSGKTSNYTGLICKAADAGYRLVIVLAGMQNSLRSQTQYRLDEGFFGFNTERATAYNQNNQRIGVGHIRVADEPVAHSLTGSAENGDFNRTVANQVNVIPGGKDPVILVVKKNQRILRNLHQWLSIRSIEDPADGRRRIRGVPLLMIDDEADNASVNTRPIPLDSDGNPQDDYDVTKINGLIRQLLDMFEKSAYVGYTATPFANIFIDPSDTTSTHGEGLFPRSFILNLPVPTSYIGPEKIFGLEASPEAGILVEQDGLPLIRYAEDGEIWIPIGHKNGFIPKDLPESLHTAIRSFILTCAARLARGQKKEHNSMLIHVTRFNSTQAAVADSVKDELRSLQNRLRYGDGAYRPRLLDELKDLWLKDFAPTSAAIREVIDDPEMRPVEWEQVRDCLVDAAMPISVKVINGSVADILDYKNSPDGVSVIAIGGDKLSRGLTLEGLSTSYFLRSSRMYDTLMQMGRWFGYRPGYADLCRLYTTSELAGWYRHIALASAELRREFEHMASIQATPRDYGLRVRTHPNGLQITSASKLRSGTVMRVSYSGTISETVVFETEAASIRNNFHRTEEFLREIEEYRSPEASEKGNRVIWEKVPASSVASFLDSFQTHPDAPKVNGHLIAQFIQKCCQAGRLKDWTVALMTGGQSENTANILPVGPVHLTRRQEIAKRIDKFCIRRIVSPSDELIDLTEPEKVLAMQKTQAAWQNKDPQNRGLKPDLPAGPFIRDVRPPERGLLLLYPVELHREDIAVEKSCEEPFIGFAVSFPSSRPGDADEGVEYHVNNIYWQQEFELK